MRDCCKQISKPISSCFVIVQPATHVRTVRSPHKPDCIGLFTSGLIETGQLLLLLQDLAWILFLAARVASALQLHLQQCTFARLVRTPARVQLAAEACLVLAAHTQCWAEKRRATERDRARASEREMKMRRWETVLRDQVFIQCQQLVNYARK